MKSLKNILSKSSNFHSLNEILQESLRIGLNDYPDANKCLLVYIIFWKSGDLKDDNQIILVPGKDCIIEDNKIYLNGKGLHDDKLALVKTGNCYYWNNTTSAINLDIIGLVGNDGIDFLQNLITPNGVLEEINMHDYYNCAPDLTCQLIYHDDKSNKYLHYNKNDINKLIDDLYE